STRCFAQTGGAIQSIPCLNPGLMLPWLTNARCEATSLSRHRSPSPGAIYFVAIGCLRTSTNWQSSPIMSPPRCVQPRDRFQQPCCKNQTQNEMGQVVVHVSYT